MSLYTSHAPHHIVMKDRIELVIGGEDLEKLMEISRIWKTTPEQAFRRILRDFYRRLHRNRT